MVNVYAAPATFPGIVVPVPALTQEAVVMSQLPVPPVPMVAAFWS